MVSQFLSEAKRQLELERGRSSLPTVQGLTLLYAVSAYNGTDRAGLIYRYAAHNMLQSMRIDRSLVSGIPSNASDHRATSKALWGLFCFERLFLSGALYIIELPANQRS
jgi:hypothetical protein